MNEQTELRIIPEQQIFCSGIDKGKYIFAFIFLSLVLWPIWFFIIPVCILAIISIYLTKYVVTNKRVLVKTASRQSEILLKKIESFEITNGWSGKYLVVRGTGGKKIKFGPMKNSEKFADAIRNQI